MSEIPQMDFDREVAAAAIPAPPADLIRLALAALRKVAADDEWFSRWLSGDDSADSRQTVATIIDVLADHVAAMA